MGLGLWVKKRVKSARSSLSLDSKRALDFSVALMEENSQILTSRAMWGLALESNRTRQNRR